MRWILAAALLLLPARQALSLEVTSLISPGGKIELGFALSADGVPTYSVNYKGNQIIRPSALGFQLRKDKDAVVFRDGMAVLERPETADDFRSGFSLVGTEVSGFDEIWTPVWGEEDSIRNHYSELCVHLVQERDGKSRYLDLVFRAYDDGVGFRYVFPDQKDLTHFVIKEECSEFAMTGDHTAWWIPGDYENQEYDYTCSRLSKIRSLLPSPQILYPYLCQEPFSPTGVQTSLQLKTDEGVYVNIHEAALVNYPCMHLDLDDERMVFTSALTPDGNGWKGRLLAPCKTPWRTIMITDDARKILASRLILNLNDPCALDDVSWIHPVKYVGVWWEMITGMGKWSYTDPVPACRLGVTDYSARTPHGKHSANTANVKRYIDFAAEHGFDQVLVEGWNIGWEDWKDLGKDYVFDFVTPYPDFDLEGLNQYARSKGVKLMMHHETSSSVVNYERHIEEAYSLMNRLGYDAVKSGYVGKIIPYGLRHYDQWMVGHYLYAVQKAAEHHIMVNAHEAVRPTGLCRTWPNLIGNESARGTEFRASRYGLKPSHVTVLPFTRLQGGPMDFTPGIFHSDISTMNPQKPYISDATICNQLALYVTMYSPLQMAADLPEHYMEYADAFRFIKDVPVDWKRSEYLAAEPGEYIVIAREDKNSPDWFVGGVTNEQARDYTLTLDFLEKGAKYTATVYTDGKDAHYHDNPECYNITEQVVKKGSRIKVHMAPGGGFTISLHKG